MQSDRTWDFGIRLARKLWDMIGSGLLGQCAKRPLLRESVVLATVCTADMLSTLYWVRNGMAVESNPLFVTPLAHSDVTFLVLKGASYLVPITVLEALRSVQPGAVVRALRACLVGYVALYALGLIGLGLVGRVR